MSCRTFLVELDRSLGDPFCLVTVFRTEIEGREQQQFLDVSRNVRLDQLGEIDPFGLETSPVYVRWDSCDDFCKKSITVWLRRVLIASLNNLIAASLSPVVRLSSANAARAPVSDSAARTFNSDLG